MVCLLAAQMDLNQSPTTLEHCDLIPSFVRLEAVQKIQVSPTSMYNSQKLQVSWITQ